MKILRYIKSYFNNASLAKFTFLQTFIVIAVYNNYVTRIIYDIIDTSSFKNAIFFASILIGAFFAVYTVYGLLFLCKATRKILAILLILANSFVTYFTESYNICVDKVMIANVFATSTNEVSDLLSVKMLITILIIGIIPAIFTLRIQFKKSKFLQDLWSFLLGLLILLIMVIIFVWPHYIRIATLFRHNKDVRDLGCRFLPSNYIISTIRLVKPRVAEKDIKKISTTMTIQDKKPSLVILVIGETAREKNFSLYGYNRNTNPLLSKQPIHVLKNTTACGTSTLVSVPCMMSHLPRNASEDKDGFEKLPEALKDIGISVLWKDNNFGGCYRVCKNVEHEFTADDKIGLWYDEKLLDGLDAYIQKHKSNKTLIVLHTNGSHGPTYYKRYPENFTIFKPVCARNDLQNCTSEELVNTFDNTIIYTDYFLNTVIDIIKKQKIPAVMLYISDHGESLGENNFFLHGFPYSIAPKEQLEIPFLVYISDEYKKTNPNIKMKNLKSYSHDNIFHSILHLFGVKSELYQKDLDIFE